MRRVKRTITEARHRLPTPAITNARGTAGPAVAAADAGAADTAKASASRARDWAMASALPSTPWRSSPTRPVRELSAMAGPFSALVVDQSEHPGGPAVGAAHLERR